MPATSPRSRPRRKTEPTVGRPWVWVGGWRRSGGGARVARRVRGNHVTGLGGSRVEDRLRLPLYAERSSGDTEEMRVEKARK